MLVFSFPAPDPVFTQTMYTVPENDRSVPLCIDIGVEISSSLSYTITTAQKSPPQAEGVYRVYIIICMYTILNCLELLKY